MKEKFGVFAISKQISGYGDMYVITDANGGEYTSIYHAEDELNKKKSLQRLNPLSKFFGSSNIKYTILPLYTESNINESTQKPYTLSYGVFRIDKKSLSKLDTSFSISSSIGLPMTFSGSLSGSLEFDIVNNSSYILTKINQFNSMSLAYDYINNVPENILQSGQNDFVVLPIYRYNK